MGHTESMGAGDVARIIKVPLSSDWGLQPDPMKLASLVMAHQPWRGGYGTGPRTRRPASHESLGRLKSVAVEARPRAIQVIGAKS